MIETKDKIVKNFVGHQVGTTLNILRNDFIRFMRSKGFNILPEQFTTLARLNISDGITQKELAEYLIKDFGSVTRSLNTLEKREWIYRMESPTDKRAKLIFITESGREMFNSTLPLITERNKQITKKLKKEDINELVRILSLIRQNCN